MQVGTILLLVVLALTGLFAALNWAAFNTPVLLSLGVTSVEAPIGLVMLGVLALVSLLFVAYAVTLHGRALLGCGATAASCRRNGSWPTRRKPRGSPSCATS